VFEQPKVDLSEFAERYLLPEFDFDVEVPAAGKEKQTYRLTGKIGDPIRSPR
jgi:hypothetical protein